MSVSIPFPSKDSIVYQRPSSNNFWERRRQSAQGKIPYSTIQFSAQDTFDFISNVAQFEQAKEIDFLRQFMPGAELRSTDNLVDQFNILFQSRERYERLLGRIKNAQAAAKNGFKGMAPNMDALYASYLNSRLTKVLQDFRASFNATTNFSDLEARFRQEVDAAILAASNDIAAVVTENDIYGSGEDWKEIAAVLNSSAPEDKYFQEQFITNIRNAIGNENLNNVLKVMYKQKDTKGKKQKTSTILRENLKLSARTASIGGNVIENTMAILAQTLGSIRGGNGSITYAMSAGAVRGEMVTTDTVMVFSGDVSVDTHGVMERLNQTLSDSEGSLDNAYYAMEKFYEQEKENMDKLYTVFINSKNYQLGGNHGTYSQHKSGTLDELDDFLARANIQVNITDDFLLTAYNTAEGAIFANNKSAVYAGAINALKAAAVKFMFDDWQTIGSGDANSIHMFMLSGKFVPSSVVFGAMADAGMKMVNGKANITVPGIDDPGPDGWPGSSDSEIKHNIYDHWKEEYDRISANSRWTADFVINVKSAINL